MRAISNRYAGDCFECAEHLGKGEGLAVQWSRGGRWALYCEGCYEDTCDAMVDSYGDDDTFGDSGYSHGEARAISRGDSTSWAAVTSSGHVTYQNRAGRCEDAPCCGCCS